MLNFLKSFSFVVMALLMVGATESQAQSLAAQELLSRDLQAGISTLKKTVRVYNYFPMSQVWDELKTPQGRANFSTRYVEDVAGRFWDLNFKMNNYIAAGPGLYLATDPFISDQQGFGNTVVELEIPAGTKYINVVAPIPVKSDTVRALIKEGFFGPNDVKTLLVSSSAPGFYRDTLKFATQAGFENFRQLVQRVFEMNGLSFIEYNWRTALIGFCKSYKYSAFVYVGTRHPSVTTKAMIPDAYRNLPMASRLVWPSPTQAEQEFATRVGREHDMLQDLFNLLQKSSKVPTGFFNKYYTDAELKQIRDTTFACTY